MHSEIEELKKKSQKDIQEYEAEFGKVITAQAKKIGELNETIGKCFDENTDLRRKQEVASSNLNELIKLFRNEKSVKLSNRTICIEGKRNACYKCCF